MSDKGYDPEVVDEKLKGVDATEFGWRVAKEIQRTMSSNAWGIVQRAFEHLDEFGFGLEWEQTRDLINRIANMDAAEIQRLQDDV